MLLWVLERVQAFVLVAVRQIASGLEYFCKEHQKPHHLVVIDAHPQRDLRVFQSDVWFAVGVPSGVQAALLILQLVECHHWPSAALVPCLHSDEVLYDRYQQNFYRSP